MTRTPTTIRVELAGGSLTVDRYGREKGAVFVLLHGIPGWRGTMRRLGNRLAPHGQVLAPDLPAFGESDALAIDGHATEHAAAVLGLLDALGHEYVHLVGFDFGGPIAVRLTALASRRVRSLTLAATNVFTDTPVPGPLKLAKLPLVGDVLFRAMFSRAGTYLLGHSAIGDKQQFPLERYAEVLAYPGGLRAARRIFLASLRDLPGLYGPVQESLAAIDAPTAVVWGDKDPFFGIATGERTAAAIRGSRFVRLEGCGHFVPEERPNELGEAVLSVVAAAG